MAWRTWWAARLGLAVRAAPVGRPDDGLVALGPSSRIDKPWLELAQEFEDAREAWRKNPLARRLVGLITSYTVGPGIRLHSEVRPLARFVRAFWAHNRLDLWVDEWSDELARSGELFLVLFTNPVSGLATVRAVPACLIEQVDYDPDDYSRELRYRERRAPGEPDKWWIGAGHAAAEDASTPLMLHYAVNRPLGAVRGESDLAPILPWLRRYSRWLEDRVRLNAAMRAFLWIVHAPARLRGALEERYRTPPEAGSVIIAEQGAETWEAVAPNLHAADAEKDGRAIRWMIVAGGPGTGLLDIGEGEDSNLATGQVMAELRRRFLRRRQAYLAWLLTDLVVHAYARWAAVTGARGRRVTHTDLVALTPDISPEDNQALATAAGALAGSLETLAGLVGDGLAFRRMALRLFGKFVGETLSENEFEAILQEGMAYAETIPGPEADDAPDGERAAGGAAGDPGGRGLDGWPPATSARRTARRAAGCTGVRSGGLSHGAEREPRDLSA